MVRPHAAALGSWKGRALGRTLFAENEDEVAIMIDTKKPFRMVHAAEVAELPDYWRSWGG